VVETAQFYVHWHAVGFVTKQLTVNICSIDDLLSLHF